MSCYDCPAAEIFPKPENHGYYSIYGYCRKKAGEAYPIYVPNGACPDCAVRARLEKSGIIKKERRNQSENP